MIFIDNSKAIVISNLSRLKVEEETVDKLELTCIRFLFIQVFNWSPVRLQQCYSSRCVPWRYQVSPLLFCHPDNLIDSLQIPTCTVYQE